MDLYVHDTQLKSTADPLLMLFFETYEKTTMHGHVSRKRCKRTSDLVLNGQMRVPK